MKSRSLNPVNIPLKRFLMAVVGGVSAAWLSQPVYAQATLSDSTITICEYDATVGVRSPLAATASLDGGAAITALEMNGHSVFIYEEFPSILALENTPENPAINSDIAGKRTLTLYETPLSIARARLSAQPAYYAQLLGLSSADALGDRTYADVDETLSCRLTAEVPEGLVTANLQPAADAESADLERMLQALPNGNYRFTSADLPFKVVSTQELLESGGAVFLFQKLGNTVVGDFYYPETDASICLEGTLNGSIVTGKGKLDGTEATAPDDAALTLGDQSMDDQSMGGRFGSAVLDLSGFSQINAGTVLPRESCE
ncbi:MAG: hypothetical protein AB8B99_21890 [Phormidesmis sp.]